MKKKIMASIMCIALVLSTMCVVNVPAIAKADATNVVTIGANLNAADKEKMFKYFNVTKDQVEVIEVNNQEERKYLEGIATEQELGKVTLSCAYIEHTTSGKGINVKIANLYWLTSNMLASALTTAGIYNCNVIAAAPKSVSGTGALTGVLKAFEKVTGEQLSEEQKELATEELYTTGTLGEELKDKDTATGIMTETKAAVIANDVAADDKEEIEKIVDEVTEKYDVNLNENQVSQVVNVMTGVAGQDYNYDDMESTFDTITNNVSNSLNIDIDLKDTVDTAKEEASGFFGSIGNFFKAIGEGIVNFFKAIGNFFADLFSSDDDDSASGDAQSKEEEKQKEDEEVGILNKTDDSALGNDAYIDSTNEGTISGGETETTTNDTGIPDGEESHVDTNNGEKTN